MLSGILQQYDGYAHVPSDIPLDYSFLPGNTTNTQSNLDTISRWKNSNQMRLNPQKSSYMVFSRSREKFVT